MEEMEKSFFSREGENWIEYRIEYTREIAEEKKRIFLPPPLPSSPRDLFLEPRWNGTLYLVRSLNPLARMISEKRSRTVVQHGDRACTNLQSLSRYVSRKEGAAKPPNRARVNDYKLAGRSVPIPGLIE